MKLLPTLLTLAGGFAAGWFLPASRPWLPTREDPTPALTTPRPDRAREMRKKGLLDRLLDETDRHRLQVEGASSLTALLAALREGATLDDEEVARIIAMNPAAALSQWLADPAISGEKCMGIAAGWSLRDPAQAIRFLAGRAGYRADNCLYHALLNAYRSHPCLVGEVFRSKPRRWQEQNLKYFFAADAMFGGSTSDHPAAEGGTRALQRNGEALLEFLADDALRELARSYWIDTAPPPAPAAETPDRSMPALDVENYDGTDWRQSEVLREQLDTQPEQTLAVLGEHGNFKARQEVVKRMMEHFSHSADSWPDSLAKLEAVMLQLAVIPEYPPSPYEMKPGFYGAETARWIARQPLGLQRAWSPSFTVTWARREPQAAIDWARSLPEGGFREQALQTGVSIWAHAVPLEAAAYVAALPAGELKESAIASAAAAWSSVDRAGAITWLASLPASPGTIRALQRAK